MEIPLAARFGISVRAAQLRLKRREDLLVGSALFIIYLALGAYLSIVKQYLPHDALARLVSAYLVFHGTEAKLASIGFVWPPIPTLLVMPFTLVPFLVNTWLAVVVVSAAFMALACILVGRIATICGVSSGWRRMLVGLFATNPLIVVFAANGMSEAILIAVALAALYWFIRFQQSDSNGHLIITGILFGLLPLIRYEMALLTAGSGVLLLFEQRTKRRQFGSMAFKFLLEGRLLGYGLLLIYPTFLWVIANWEVMGNPLYFLINDRSALSVAEIDLGGLDVSPLTAFHLAFKLWILAFPAGLLALLTAIVVGVRRRTSFVIGLGLLAFIIPLLQGLLLSRSATVPLIRYFVMVVPLTLVISLATIREVGLQASGSGHSPVHMYHRVLAGLAIVFLASNMGTGLVLANPKYRDFEYDTWISLTTKNKVSNESVTDAMAVGHTLTQIVPPGSKVLLDHFQFGFAVFLGAQQPTLFLDHTHPQYKKALRRPQDFVDYVLVPKPEGRGAFYDTNRIHPTLYWQGAPWAELVDPLPPTKAGWRLYKVRR